MEPIRKLQTASHFKKVQRRKSRPETLAGDLLEPCSPGDSGATEIDLMKVDPEKIVAPDVSLDDFFKALMRVKPSVSYEDLERHVKFTEDFGSEGA